MRWLPFIAGGLLGLVLSLLIIAAVMGTVWGGDRG